ncbi:fumarylacetoacetate hydrolase family protein [Amycolatopsis endophytica]|uniref:2-keto-4-pentenoate hydratase/2-oxohepta-3-ene-1,7-dioic acid hydratase in catechol pathway n=1 Tax=Amycolatopsis endophytica TaxID=860233 RepID=A0A853BC26_9PSEU|nr:fumarylacetoacetate hydrolase family protein [Amycolatopsis endophytica]NYI92335.1 2-keto-4-pentenoate hydratase/2-oxohepta-3-ene-1,7-dioic acid hydratase in catechol pathway [Amycolatopsis endophytica]
MSINVVRTEGSWWVERPDGTAVEVATTATTTRELLGDVAAVEKAAESGGAGVAVGELALISPVTAPCRVAAQMVNYRSHARDSGFDPDTVQPTFFRKASGSITGPHGTIRKPAHVRLLDYEVELGLVMGAELPVGTRVTEPELSRYIAGLVVTNDVSARDVQLSKGQFYESKSYPTFTPVGPRLTLLGADEFTHLLNLRLRLSVNKVLRQDRTVADMIVRPAEALTALAGFQALSPGDLVLTGTPGGTALTAPPKLVEKIGALLPPEVKWKTFFARQARNPAYLRPGDVVEADIATPDGTLDLGTQRCTVA